MMLSESAVSMRPSLTQTATTPLPVTDISYGHKRLVAALLMSGLLLSGCATRDPVSSDEAFVSGKAKQALLGGDDTISVTAKAYDYTGKKKLTDIPVAASSAAKEQAKLAAPLYEQALTTARGGNTDAAIAQLNTITAQYPDLSNAALSQAILLRKKGKLDEAANVLQKSMLSATQNPRVYNEYGYVSRLQGKFKQAKTAYLGATRLAPEYDKPHYNLAVLADLYLNDLPLAISEFDIYQNLQPQRDKRIDAWLKDLKRRAGAK